MPIASKDEAIALLTQQLAQTTASYERLLLAYGKPFEWGMLQAESSRDTIAAVEAFINKQ